MLHARVGGIPACEDTDDASGLQNYSWLGGENITGWYQWQHRALYVMEHKALDLVAKL